MFFSELELIPPDPIFGLAKSFLEDKRQNKINLTVGIFYGEDLQCDVLKSVKEAEKIFLDKEKDKQYLPMLGMSEFLKLTGELAFGKEGFNSHIDRMTSCQSIGGTGALRIAAEALNVLGSKKVVLPNPTWANHKKIFSSAGLDIDFYPYFDKETQAIDFEAMISFLEGQEPKTGVVLHACCHNPTGCDLSQSQWQKIYEVTTKKQLIPIFDMAYLGFGDTIEHDAYSVRFFLEKGQEFFLCFSYSKIFGLYGERVGAVFALADDKKSAELLSSNIQSIVRGNYSNPPKHGSALVVEVLSNDDLRAEWEKELAHMRERIVSVRSLFADKLIEKGFDAPVENIKKMKGLFCLLPLDAKLSSLMIEKYAIYLTSSGRVNLTGLSKQNVEYVCRSLVEVMSRR